MDLGYNLFCFFDIKDFENSMKKRTIKILRGIAYIGGTILIILLIIEIIKTILKF